MNFKRTKVICTIGPSTQSYSSLKKLKEAGMDVIRFSVDGASQDVYEKNRVGGVFAKVYEGVPAMPTMHCI